MQFRNDTVRRQDRLLDKERALELLRTAPWGVLSMQAEEGGGYGVPLNFVWDGQRSIYIHCAPEGRKIRSLSHCGRVSFCIVGHTRLVPEKFTSEYESVVLWGMAYLGLSEDEKRMAMRLLLEKLAPAERGRGDVYIEKSFSRVEVIRVDFEAFTAKRKQVNPSET